MKKITEYINDSIVIGDGAMGTMLQNYGLRAGEIPESWVLKHPDKLLNIHREYIAAGSRLIETNTFGGNRIKLKAGGLENKVEEINSKAVAIARDAAEGGEYIAGSVGPTGKMMEPYGQLNFNDALEAYREQIEILVKSGVDIILLETMSDLQEIRAAVIASKKIDIPVIAQMTFSERMASLMGNTPEVAAIVLDSLDVDIIGVNCTSGIEYTLPIIKRFFEVTDKPLSVYPNAGKPVLKNGQTTYPQIPDKFSEDVSEFLKYNVRILGGCCGTTPEHIEIMKKRLISCEDTILKENYNNDKEVILLASSRKHIKLSKNENMKIIREIDDNENIKEYLYKIKDDSDLIFLNIDLCKYEGLLSNLMNPLIIRCENNDKLGNFLQDYAGKVLIIIKREEEELLETAEKYGADTCNIFKAASYGLEDIFEYRKPIAGLKRRN